MSPDERPVAGKRRRRRRPAKRPGKETREKFVLEKMVIENEI